MAATPNDNKNFVFDIGNNTITYTDKSSYKSVFIGNFIAGVLLSLFAVWSCLMTKHSDVNKSTYKWLGWLFGTLMQIALIMFIVGIVFTTQAKSTGYILLPIGTLLISLIIVFFIKTVKKINKNSQV